MSDKNKKFIVIVWGEEGLTNEIGFVNFCDMAAVAMSISTESYCGWLRLTESACIVIPVENGIDKAIDAVLESHDTVDIRIMTKVMVDNLIIRG